MKKNKQNIRECDMPFSAHQQKHDGYTRTRGENQWSRRKIFKEIIAGKCQISWKWKCNPQNGAKDTQAADNRRFVSRVYKEDL